MDKPFYIGEKLDKKMKPIRDEIIYKLIILLDFDDGYVDELIPIEYESSVIDDLSWGYILNRKLVPGIKKWHMSNNIDQILKELIKLIMFTDPSHTYYIKYRTYRPFFDGEVPQPNIYVYSKRFEQFANSVINRYPKNQIQKIFDEFAQLQLNKYCRTDLLEKLTPIKTNSKKCGQHYTLRFPYEARIFADELRKTYMKGKLILNVVVPFGPFTKLQSEMNKLQSKIKKLGPNAITKKNKERIQELQSQINSSIMKLPPALITKIAGLVAARPPK